MLVLLCSFHGHAVPQCHAVCLSPNWSCSNYLAVCQGCRAICSWCCPLRSWFYASRICSGYLQSSSGCSFTASWKKTSCGWSLLCSDLHRGSPAARRGCLVLLWSPAVTQFAPFGHGWAMPSHYTLTWNKYFAAKQIKIPELIKFQLTYFYSSETFVEAVPKNGFLILFCYLWEINGLQHTSYCKQWLWLALLQEQLNKYF